MNSKITFILFLFFYTEISYSSSFSAKILHFKGDVYVNRAGKKIKAKKSLKLEQKDTVVTGKNSLALISLYGTGRIKLDPDTTLRLTELHKKNKKERSFSTNLYLKVGNIVINFVNEKDEEKPTKKLQVESKHIALGVRGTKFFLGHDKGEHDGHLFFHVDEGNVLVMNQLDDDHEVVKGGEGIHIKKGRHLHAPQKFEWAKKLNYGLSEKKLKASRFHHKELISHRVREVKRIQKALKKRKRKPFKHLKKLKKLEFFKQVEFDQLDDAQKDSIKRRRKNRIRRRARDLMNPPPTPPGTNNEGNGTQDPHE